MVNHAPATRASVGRRPPILAGAAAIVALIAASPTLAAAANPAFTTLYDFVPVQQNVGVEASFGVVLDPTGALIGATQLGSTCAYGGSVFRVVPPAPGSAAWTESIILDVGCFLPGDLIAGIGVGPKGTVYGTSGTTVFEIVPSNQQTVWTPSAIATMADPAGTAPYIGPGGVVYLGGAATSPKNPLSDAISITPPAQKGGWTTQTIWTFNTVVGGWGQQGGAMVQDAAGALYGGTVYGGKHRKDGTIIRLTPPTQPGNPWSKTVLFNFNGANGRLPESSLLVADDGSLIGTTHFGGPNTCTVAQLQKQGCGTVFQLTPPQSGKGVWQQTVLHAFSGADGAAPGTNLVQDNAGNLFGLTAQGGGKSYGTLFELSPPAAGQTAWTFTTVWTFDKTNGAPGGNLAIDAAGNFYGTTQAGGAYGEGAVWQITR